MTLVNLQLSWAEIYPEFYGLYRGQASNIPQFGSREYQVGIHLGNSAIKAWERTDGVLWRELIDLASNQSTTIWPTNQRTVATGDTTYTAPTNMRKWPAKIRLTSGDRTFDVPVIDPQDVKDMSDNASYCYFTGGASAGYTMNIPTRLASNYDGFTIDYVYYKKATLLRTDVDPAATVPEMSDPNFIIQKMLAQRWLQSKNGMGYNASTSEADRILANMKLEATSGVYNNSWNEKRDARFGKALTQQGNDIASLM